MTPGSSWHGLNGALVGKQQGISWQQRRRGGRGGGLHPWGPRSTERIYHLSRQVLELRRAMAPLTEMLNRLAGESHAPTGKRLRRRYQEQRVPAQRLAVAGRPT